MKKVFLLSSMAVMAMGAFAQYTCDPTTEALLEKGAPSKVWYVTLSETSVAALESAGSSVLYVGPSSEEGRNFWYWNGWEAGPETNPRVGFEDGGYMSLTVTGEGGWSGGGVAINGPLSQEKGAGVDLSGMSDDTHFHFAYCTNGTAPSSVAIILLDDEANGSKPAKFSFGKEAFNDNGAIYPLVAGEITDEWQGVDIKLSDIKKLYPSFTLANLSSWGGNIVSMLSGAVPQTNFCLDAMYFYNEGDANAVEGVEAEATFVVTDRTVNSSVAGIEVYNTLGQRVAASRGTVCGIDGLSAGIYVAKAGSKTVKFVKK